MIEILPQEDVIRVAVTLWAIWYARRKAIHENVYQSPLSTHNFVDKLVSEIGEEAHVQRPQARVRERRTASIVPSSGFIKINVNATLSKNVSMASTATIGRDEDGCFMGASALVLRGIVDPEVMESIACREGMALVADLQADSFRLASDCLNMVKSIRQGDLGIYGQVIREINARKATFSSVEFVHD